MKCQQNLLISWEHCGDWSKTSVTAVDDMVICCHEHFISLLAA